MSKRRMVSKTMEKKSSIVPIVKPGKEVNRDASKYQPISLLNVAGKVLDRLMIELCIMCIAVLV